MFYIGGDAIKTCFSSVRQSKTCRGDLVKSKNSSVSGFLGQINKDGKKFNGKELRNCVVAMEHAVDVGELEDCEVFLFTDILWKNMLIIMGLPQIRICSIWYCA